MPLARTSVTPKPRQDDPLSGLVGKRHSTGGQRSQGSPCCVRVSGGLMNPDRIATEAESLQSYIWIIWLDSETESSLLEGGLCRKKTFLKFLSSAWTHKLRIHVVNSLTWRQFLASIPPHSESCNLQRRRRSAATSWLRQKDLEIN